MDIVPGIYINIICVVDVIIMGDNIYYRYVPGINLNINVDIYF